MGGLRATHRMAAPAVARLSTRTAPAAHCLDGLKAQAKSSDAAGEGRAADRSMLAVRRPATVQPLQLVPPTTTERRPGAPDPEGRPARPCSWPGQRTHRHRTLGRPPCRLVVLVHRARCQRGGGRARHRAHMASRLHRILQSVRLRRGRTLPHRARRPGPGRRLPPRRPTQTPTRTTRHRRCVEAAGG